MTIATSKFLAPIAIAILIQGCAASGGGSTQEQTAAMECPAGYIMTCDVTSSGRISDGRYGHRNRNLRGRRNCGCQPEENFEEMEGETLPRDTR